MTTARTSERAKGRGGKNSSDDSRYKGKRVKKIKNDKKNIFEIIAAPAEIRSLYLNVMGRHTYQEQLKSSCK